jgi:hypothetical protein
VTRSARATQDSKRRRLGRTCANGGEGIMSQSVARKGAKR